MGDITKDINDYLDRIKETSNQDIFDIYLSKWGDIIVPAGLAVVVDRMRQFGDAAPNALQLNTEELNQLILYSGMQWLAGLQDAIVALRNKGYKKLLEGLSHPDEDVRSIAALELASAAIKNKESVPHLENAYKNAKGTGLQLAIAIALGRQNHLLQYVSLARKYVIRGEQEGYQYIVQLSRSTYKEMKENGTYDRLKMEGEEIHNSYEEAVNSSIYMFTYEKAMSLVVYDISTRGKLPKFLFPDWIY